MNQSSSGAERTGSRGAKSGPSRSSIAMSLMLVGVAGYLYYASSQIPPNGVRSPAVGKTVQTLELKSLTGSEDDLSLGDLQGRVTLINFWGTWCPPCLKEFPHLLRLRSELAVHEDFQFISVSCPSTPSLDEASLREETLSFLESAGARLPTHSDLMGRTRGAFAESYGQTNLPFPTTVIVDRQGTIRGLWLGYLPGDEQQVREAAMRQLMDASEPNRE